MPISRAETRDGTEYYLGISDNDVEHLFDRKAAFPAKARRLLTRGIGRTLTELKAASTDWYQLKNKVVALTVRVSIVDGWPSPTPFVV